MPKTTISQKIYTARNKVSDINISYTTLNLQYLIKIIKARKKEKPDLTIQDIISEIEDLYKNIAIGPNHGSSIASRSDFCMLRALKHVQKHPEVIFEILDTSDRSLFITRKSSFIYTPNLRESIQELLTDACSSILYKADIPTKVRFIKGEFTIQERESLQKQILAIITNYKPIKEKQIKDYYISVITKIAQFLDEQGCFEKSIESHNRSMRMLGLSEMQETTPDKKDKSTQVYHMSYWKDPNIVGNLPLEALIMAYAFFTNRLCKEYIHFRKSVFLMSELNFSEDDILKTNNITPEKVSPALIKYEFLQAEVRKNYSRLYQQFMASSNISTISETYHESDYELDYEPQEYEDYNRLFSTILPDRDNNFKRDFDDFVELNNVMEILYTKKDMALDSLIMYLLDNESNINWGYIEEKTGDGNSIERKQSMIVLGFDLGKFNTSIRLHKSLNELKKLIAQFTGSDILPVYAGNEDWSIKDQFGIPKDMTTQVFRMFTKKERKQLKQQSASLPTKDRLHGFISHLNWLANGITPQKYKKRNIVHLNTGKIEELGEIQR